MRMTWPRLFAALTGLVAAVAIGRRFIGAGERRARVTIEEFEQKALRVHAFLADIPLHDVWAIHLRGGGDGRTLRHFGDLLSFEGLQRTNALVPTILKQRNVV